MPTGIHVLVVDDEPDFLDAILQLLSLEGFRATGERSGTDALRRLAEADFPKVDVFLIDYRMPGLNGGETLARIRSAGLSGCAILVSAATDVARIANEFGFDEVVRKPCDLDELLTAIKRCSHAQPGEPARSSQ
jgi:CheY-like chemotaxis protein